MTTFVRVTNRDIFDELKDFKKINGKQHLEIIKHQLVTNGKVRLNKWIAGTALTIILIVVGILVGM